MYPITNINNIETASKLEFRSIEQVFLKRKRGRRRGYAISAADHENFRGAWDEFANEGTENRRYQSKDEPYSSSP